MDEIIKNAAKIIAEEEKKQLKPWERTVVSSCEKVAEALNQAENQKATEATAEEAINLIKNL